DIDAVGDLLDHLLLVQVLDAGNGVEPRRALDHVERNARARREFDAAEAGIALLGRGAIAGDPLHLTQADILARDRYGALRGDDDLRAQAAHHRDRRDRIDVKAE